MPLRVFKGHFAALEPSFVASVDELRQRGRLAVVTSGRAQLERLQELLLAGTASLAGVEFFPGFPHLATRLSNVPAGRVSRPGLLDTVFMAMEAARGLGQGVPFSDVAENPRAALSLAQFLEELLEKGADAAAYSLILKTLKREPTATEESLGRILESYEDLRRGLCPSAPDRLVMSALGSGRFDRFAAYLFYGLYDLNPLQRRFTGRLLSVPGADVRWFTPLTPGPAGRLGIAGKTTSLLDRGIQMHREDSEIRQGACGAFGESLVSSRVGRVPEAGFEYVLVHGSSGAARAALQEVASARSRGVPLSRMAVIGRKSQTLPVARQARAEGIPLYRSPEISLSALPAGAMARAAIQALEHDCHHMYLRAIPATGALRDACSPDGKEIDEAILLAGPRTGIRGMGRAVGALAGFARLKELLGRLELLEDRLGETVVPSSCLPQTLAALTEMADEGPAGVLSAVSSALETLWAGPVSRRVFTQSLILALENFQARVGESEDSGLRILDFEDARGLEFDTVVIVGLEEGVIPSSGFDDPRLSADLRSGLDIPSAPTREKEEAFLLALACGSASKRLVFVQRLTDDSGGTVQHSPLVDPILDEWGRDAAGPFPGDAPLKGGARTGSPSWLRRQKADPLRILFDGSDPGQRAVLDAADGRITTFLPFLPEALEADGERRWSEGLGDFDGVIGPEASSMILPGSLSPTFLGAWGRCPFRCLAERGWGLQTPPEVGVTVSPDPLSRGTFLHGVIESALATGLSATEAGIMRIIESGDGFSALAARLGSEALREVFVRDSAALVLSFLAMLREHGTKVLQLEAEIDMEVGGVRLSGRADLLLETPSGICVVDIKTGRRVPGKAELLREIKGGCDYQIPLYCAALERSGRHVSAAGYFYCAPVPVAHRFEGEELEEIIAAALENAPRAAALALGGMYFPIPGDGCGRCPWRGLCRRSDYFAGRIERILKADDELGWLHRRHAGGKGNSGGS